MATDARFEDADEKALYLQALDTEDLQVVSALVQDAVFAGADMGWDAIRRRFSILLNRFRWEADRASEPERVRSVLVVSDVMKVASQGVSPKNRDVILSILSISFQEGEDGTGALILTLAGDGAIRLGVETIDVTLKDVTQPYKAVSGHRPTHE